MNNPQEKKKKKKLDIDKIKKKKKKYGNYIKDMSDEKIQEIIDRNYGMDSLILSDLISNE